MVAVVVVVVVGVAVVVVVGVGVGVVVGVGVAVAVAVAVAVCITQRTPSLEGVPMEHLAWCRVLRRDTTTMSSKNALITRLNDKVTPLAEVYLHSKFDDHIDEEGSVTIAGVEFIRSRILNEMDPIAYNEAFSNWLDQSGDYVEIEGSYYPFDEAREFLEELRDELEESIGEAEEEEEDPDKEEVDLLAEVERVLDTCF